MELPVINFESLNNPSFISRLFSIFELNKLSPTHRIWKWGALFLALVYAFSSLVNKIKILILYYHNKSKSLLSEPLLAHLNDAFDSDYSDDENDDVCSISNSESDSSSDEEEDIDSSSSSSYDDDFNVKGSFRNFNESQGQKRKFKFLRRRKSLVDNFSLSELINGTGVVKLWDGLGLGVLDVHDSFSFLDVNNNNEIISSSIFSGIPAVSMSPAVFISAGNSDGKLGLDIWDLRSRVASSPVHSEWRSDRRRNMIEVDAGLTGKVYVRDDVTSRLTVGDVRKVGVALTEYEEEMWWDADGVSGMDESTNEFTE